MRGGALTAPIPPALVTVGDMENSNVLTVAWTGILATVPPKTYISVRPTRHSYGMLVEGKEFVINLPPANLVKTVDYVGIYTGKKVDKFKTCNLTKIESSVVAPPTIDECPIALECRVEQVLSFGSHDVFIADILSVSCHDDIIDGEGKMHFELADLLAYAHGEYYKLGECVGKFGFSTRKEKSPATSKKAESPNSNTPVSKQEGKNKNSSEIAKRPFYENLPKKSSSSKASRDKNNARKSRKGAVKK